MVGRFTRVTLATAVAVGGLVAGVEAPAAQAKTVKACVKKKTGEMRILTKKKCKKGWKKVSWNQKGKTGPQGNQGAQGPNLMVKDGAGNTMGRFLGVFPMGLPLIFVEIDGGGYTFMPNGLLYPLGSGSPQFKTNACTGTGYVPADSELSKQLYVGSAGGPTRLVWRRTDPSLGAALAWKFTTATENVVATQMYELDNDGTCDPVSGGAYSGTLVAMESVPAPADVPGPLTIG